MFAPMLAGMLLVAGMRLRDCWSAPSALALVVGRLVWTFGMQRLPAPARPHLPRARARSARRRLPGAAEQDRRRLRASSPARGYMQGTQSQLRFLPARHTDFIFAVLAEEWGFLGVATVLGALRRSTSSSAARSRCGRATAPASCWWSGCSRSSPSTCSTTRAMVIGLVPITGIPLPFLSYGGSFTLLNFIATGLILGVDLPALRQPVAGPGNAAAMADKMLVESDPHQTRIAVLEDDRLTEIFVERHRHRGVVGNVYKGRVTRVLPGMQAAFVDIGLERDAFLYVSDVADGAAERSRSSRSPRVDAERDRTPAPPGDASRRRSTTLLQARPGAAGAGDQGPAAQQGRAGHHPRHAARAATSCCCRRCATSASRAASRTRPSAQRLRGAARGSCRQRTGGLIVRTAGEGRERRGVRGRPRLPVAALGARSRERAERAVGADARPPDLDLALRVVRDLFCADFSVLWVDGEETYERIVEFLDQVQPALVAQASSSTARSAALFERFGIDDADRGGAASPRSGSSPAATW